MESSGRNDENEKCSNRRRGREKELLDRKRVLAGKLEGLYSGKEQKMFKEEGKQSVKKRELSKVVRKLIGRVLNWENVWEEEEEGLVVREWGRRMVAEEWSIRVQALVKKQRVTGRKSTTFVWVPISCIGPKLGQIQPLSSSLDSPKCNLDKNTKAAWM